MRAEAKRNNAGDKAKPFGNPTKKYIPTMEAEQSLYDARFIHPFSCLVAGPSGSGKSSFVYELLTHEGTHINISFDFIRIYLGTEAKENELLSNLKELYPSRVELIVFRDQYPTKEDAKTRFPLDLESYIRTEKRGEQGIVIFDDLMTEMAENSVLVDMFTKHRSHLKVSCINITQNIFFKGKSEQVSVYRNATYLVVFYSPMDGTTLQNIALRLGWTGKMYKRAITLLRKVTEENRYVVVTGGFKTPKVLRFRTRLFDAEGTQTVYEL